MTGSEFPRAIKLSRATTYSQRASSRTSGLLSDGIRGKIECIEALHRWEMRRPDAPLDHASYPIDEFEFGEPQKITRMVEPFPRGFRCDLVIFTQEGLTCGNVDAFPYWGKFTSETALPGWATRIRTMMHGVRVR